ncbi:MAG: FCD domain-containing protein [Armatimonadota bacterium]|nr:FCD domain-containing protein [Armatimonadota bacterium]
MRWLLRHGASLEEVLQVREAVEAQAASLAASRATAKAVQRLERLLAEGDALVASYRGRPVDEGLLEAYVRLDEAFHDTLAQLAGYRFLRNLLHALASAIADSRAATLAIPGRIQRSLREHRAILRAVSRRDPEAARRAMRAHVRRVLAEVRSVRHHPSRPLSAKQT